MKQNIDDLHLCTLHAGYAEHYCDWNWVNVRSPFARLYYVTEGEAEIIIYNSAKHEQERIVLRPHNLYLIPPFTLHSNVCCGVFKHYYIHVIENTSDSFNYFTGFDYPKEVPASKEVDLPLFQTLIKINQLLSLSESAPASYNNDESLKQNINLGKQRPLCDRVESRGILYILLSRFLRHAKLLNRIKDERINRTIEYMSNHIDEPVDVVELSMLANLSKDHYIRKFSKETGMTPLAYFIERKIEIAESLLIATNLPVKSIAFNLGFKDSTYFYRLFKKHVGKSPNKYREDNI